MMTTSEDDPNIPYLPSVGRLLGFASRATTTLSEQRLADHELTIQQWVLLTALWRNDGMTISQLAAYGRIREPTASGLVDRMAAKGLVDRRRDAEDRRKVLVCLTDKGRAQSGLIGFYEQINDVLLAGFTDREKAVFISLMERLIGNVENALGNGKTQ